jgi:hypothetical protein
MIWLNQGTQDGKKAIDLGGAKDVLVRDNLIRDQVQGALVKCF